MACQCQDETLEELKAMEAKLRSDKRKTPTMYPYRYMTYEELLALKSQWGSPRVHVLDRYGDICEVKITSIKTWKRRPDVEVHWKYGLYEYGSETVKPNEPQTFFVILEA